MSYSPTVIPAERSESRDPCVITATLTDRMGPGSAPLRGLAGMTEERVSLRVQR
jgi:hypothetical protein